MTLSSGLSYLAEKYSLVSFDGFWILTNDSLDIGTVNSIVRSLFIALEDDNG